MHAWFERHRWAAAAFALLAVAAVLASDVSALVSRSARTAEVVGGFGAGAGVLAAAALIPRTRLVFAAVAVVGFLAPVVYAGLPALHAARIGMIVGGVVFLSAFVVRQRRRRSRGHPPERPVEVVYLDPASVGFDDPADWFPPLYQASCSWCQWAGDVHDASKPGALEAARADARRHGPRVEG